MGRRLVPAGIAAASLAFAVASVAFGFTPEAGRLWGAAVALVVLGGITPLIYTVNVRILPVFSRRAWPSPRMLAAAIGAAVSGAWLVFLGRATGSDAPQIAGSAVALAGGVLFNLSVFRLFRSLPVSNVAPPLPFPEQADVDRIGRRFTRLAGLYLLLGLSVGLMLTLWTPGRGRWDLVWAHAMLVGWFLTMASGFCYHTLPRWTGHRWRHPRLIGVHLRLVEVGLPFMVLALAFDLRWLFAVAGPLQTVALWLLVWNLVPQALRLPRSSRLGMTGAGLFLALGVAVGASMAIDPTRHVILRFSHAEINLLGWAGLLISGVGYYLFPRFAGQPLRWPRLALVQIAMNATGVLVSATAWWWYLRGVEPARLFVAGGSLLSGTSFLLFGLMIALTFRRTGKVVASVALQRRPRPAA